MNYYYDIILNFLDSNYLFYDWLEQDTLEYIKKIPLYQVTSKKFKEIYAYEGKISLEFLEEIKDKTISKNKKLKYACLIADKNNALALEFNDEGLVIARSSLMLKDELALLEYLYTIPLKDIEYTKIKLINNNLDSRKSRQIKNFISLELKKLINDHNLEKLKYLYLEWFNEKEDNLDKIRKRMEKRLENEITLDEIKIYNIIKLSYNNV